MKIIRWKYVLPRLVISLILGLLIRFGIDPALKWALVASGEAAVGAKVELASLTTSLSRGELEIEGLAIANPQSPMRNLLESSDSQLQIDINALLHGRVVVTSGTVHGLQFDTKRETSGALQDTESDEETGPSALDPLLASVSQVGEAWFDQLGDRLDTDIADQLQSPRVAQELQERWPAQYAQLQGQVKSIRQRGKELEKSIREVKENPLRGFQQLAQLQQDLTSLQKEVQSVQQQIGNLPKQAAADRQAVHAARLQDEALIRQKLQVGSIDGEGLTQTILGEPVSRQLASMLEWLSWAREQVPAKSSQAKAGRGRGTTVLFTPPRPSLQIEQLQLEGSAQFNGQPLQLIGALTGASNAPQLLPEPTRLELRGSEAMALEAEIVLDRRGGTPIDTLHCVCPQLAMAAQTLGSGKKLAIELGSGVANFELELRLTGDELAGEIRFAQESLQLTPRLAKRPNGKMAAVLTEALAAVRRLQANVTLAGTVKKPQFAIESDIGNQVALGLNSTVQRLMQDQTDAVLAKSRQQVDEQMRKLDTLRTSAQQELLGQLGEGQALLGQLAAITGGNGLNLPAGFPQLGKSLRLDGLRK